MYSSHHLMNRNADANKEELSKEPNHVTTNKCNVGKMFKECSQAFIFGTFLWMKQQISSILHHMLSQYQA